jgi:hypothetical protein
MKLFCYIIERIHVIQSIINPISVIIITMYYSNFINHNIAFTTRNKFDYLSSVLHNDNLLYDVKEDFICVFCKSQHVYWTLSRFIRKIKSRK